MTPERSEDDKELEFMPVFCTAEIPVDVLNDFLKSSYEGRDAAEIFIPALLTTKDINGMVQPSREAPKTGFTSPFLDWSVDDCYDFFRSSIAPLGGELSGAWPAHTFVVLDKGTADDKTTCFLCSDVPDYLERERVVLKSVRCEFAFALLEGMCYETFVRCPSESGGGALGVGDVVTGDNAVDYQALSIMPPPMSGEAKRAAASFGVTNDSIPEERRWWTRYQGEGTEGS